MLAGIDQIMQMQQYQIDSPTAMQSQNRINPPAAVQQPPAGSNAPNQNIQPRCRNCRNLHLFKRGRMTNVETVLKDYQGRMRVLCPECKALHWDAEKLSGSTRDGIVFGMCCLTGKVELPLSQQAPTGLQKLFDGRDAHSAFFLKNICQYNAMFAFTSIGIQNHSITGGGPYVFKIRGELHHRIGAFLPMNDEREKYCMFSTVGPTGLVCDTPTPLGPIPKVIVIRDKGTIRSQNRLPVTMAAAAAKFGHDCKSRR